MYKRTFIFKDKNACKRFVDKIGRRITDAKGKSVIVPLKYDNEKYIKEALKACKVAIGDLNNFVSKADSKKEASDAIFVRNYVKEVAEYNGPDKIGVILSNVKYIPKKYLDTYEVAEIYRELINDLQVIKNKSKKG